MVACDGVLNSSLCCVTTHTGAGGTGAGHYNSHHQVFINWSDYIRIEGFVNTDMLEPIAECEDDQNLLSLNSRFIFCRRNDFAGFDISTPFSLAPE